MKAYWGEGHKVHAVLIPNTGHPETIWISLCGLYSRNTIDIHPTATHVNCKKCEKVYTGN